LGGLYLEMMVYDLARSHLEQALAMAQEVGSSVLVQTAGACLGLLYLEIGEASRAEALLATLVGGAPVSYHDHFCMIARCRLALQRKQPELVLQLFDSCQPAFVTSKRVNWINLGLHLSRAEALVALDDPEAEDELRRTVSLAQAAGLRSLLWRAQIALSEYLLSKKRTHEAEQELASARALIEVLAEGIEQVEIRAAFLQAALGMLPDLALPTPRQAAKRAFDGLTAAEQQIAALVAQGKSNREIAAAQVVSIKTVEAHISRILSKLGFASRAQIAVWAVEKGLLAASGES
jgi:DNA-binding NarL/FixJ family response regulator